MLCRFNIQKPEQITCRMENSYFLASGDKSETEKKPYKRLIQKQQSFHCSIYESVKAGLIKEDRPNQEENCK